MYHLNPKILGMVQPAWNVVQTSWSSWVTLPSSLQHRWLLAMAMAMAPRAGVSDRIWSVASLLWKGWLQDPVLCKLCCKGDVPRYFLVIYGEYTMKLHSSNILTPSLPNPRAAKTMCPGAQTPASDEMEISYDGGIPKQWVSILKLTKMVLKWSDFGWFGGMPFPKCLATSCYCTWIRWSTGMSCSMN